MFKKDITLGSVISLISSMTLLLGGFLISANVRMSNVEEKDKIQDDQIKILNSNIEKVEDEAKQYRKDVQSKLDRIIEFQMNKK